MGGGGGGQRQGVALLLLRLPLWHFGLLRPILLLLVSSRRRMAIRDMINIVVVVAASE
jgi:hypothetical protein